MTLILKILRYFDAFSNDNLYDLGVANPNLNIERDKNGQILSLATHLLAWKVVL